MSLSSYDSSDPSRLTRRETEIAHLAAAGATNPEIAKKLGLTTNTVKTYIQAVLRKCELRNRTELARYLPSLQVAESTLPVHVHLDAVRAALDLAIAEVKLQRTPQSTFAKRVHDDAAKALPDLKVLTEARASFSGS